ncbi:Acetyl-CoA synthetase-like protein [Mycena chlorophos]|uniref:Acetyl-CoA synthetase-like protein n=1 Tax=Mycena chlorophos TaxID=658473 RepID=A0A8H6SIX8_MYCCL|nr:Acetyl-CoA synthetase-like protein [Mycena chlorophos]
MGLGFPKKPSPPMAPFVPPPIDDPSFRVTALIDHHRTVPNLTPALSWGNDDGTVTDISHFEFARAAHRAAELLRPGRGGGEEVDGATVAILAMTDALIAQTLVAGCILAGLLPFPISPRNPEAALIHLLISTKAHRIIVTRASVGPIVDPLVESMATKYPSYNLTVEELPTFKQLYPYLSRETPDDPFTPYPLASAAPASTDPALILHSSGSTGLPKPIVLSNSVFLSFCRLENIAEMARCAPRFYTGMMPTFHAFAILVHIMTPLVHGMTSCLAPPATVEGYRVPPAPSPDSVLLNARKAKVQGIVTVPAFVLDWAKNDKDVEYLVSLNILVFGSGPLASKVGDDLVRRGVKFGQVYGSTESGPTNKLVATGLDKHEWSWMEMSERAQVRWEPAGNGIFEAQYLTAEGIYHPAVENLPDVRGYSTRDLFEQHPTKPHLYRIVGRLDDVIVLGNGEKAVPGPMEDILSASPHVAGVVIFGRGRLQLGLLVQPSPARAIDPNDQEQLAEYRNLIWSVVEEANAIAPTFAWIYKEMIVVTESGRPMVKSPKGSVAKKATLELYAKEIDTLYDTIEARSNAASEASLPFAWTVPNLQPWLLFHASSLSGKTIDHAIDLFEQGFDSLNATFLRHRIVGALRAAPVTLDRAQAIPQNLIYTHSSVEKLAHALEGLVNGSTGDGRREAAAAIEAMVAKYSSGLDVVLAERQIPSSDGAVVLLTGSTGGLGSHMLELLVPNPAIKKIFAFNRSNEKVSILQRHEAAFADRALDSVVLKSEKLVFMEGDSTRSDLGLSPQEYTELQQSVTLIIHNAWALDFNKTLVTFEPHVVGTRNLIDFARSTTADPRFVFTSSAGSVQSWNPSHGPVPEETLDASVAVGVGYGESKYVAERLLAASGLRATSIRIGQVTGSASNGAWSTSEWVPGIVKSSITLGHFPADPGAFVPFISPEAVAKAVVDTALLNGQEVPVLLNVVHPRPVSWDFAFGALAKASGVGKLVSIDAWLREVEGRAVSSTATDLEQVPAIKIVEFLRTTISRLTRVTFSTSRVDEITSALKDMKELDERDVEKWIGYWRGSGFI